LEGILSAGSHGPYKEEPVAKAVKAACGGDGKEDPHREDSGKIQDSRVKIQDPYREDSGKEALVHKAVRKEKGGHVTSEEGEDIEEDSRFKIQDSRSEEGDDIGKEILSISPLGCSDVPVTSPVISPNQSTSTCTLTSPVFLASNASTSRRICSHQHVKGSPIAKEGGDIEGKSRFKIQDSRLKGSPIAKEALKLEMKVSTQSGLEGKVAFVGPTLFAPGLWVGVVLEGPFGKSDGSFHGEECFQCKPNHGLFVRPSMLRKVTSEPPQAPLSISPLPVHAMRAE